MALREILAKFGFEVDSSKLDKAKNDTNQFTDKLKQLGGVALGATLIGKFKDFVSEMRESASGIKRLSNQMGISVQDAQRWTTAADLVGVSAESLANGVKFLQKNAVEAAEKGGDAAAVFKALGVEVKDAAGNMKPTSQILGDAGLAIGAMSDPAKRTAATLKVFGRQGLELLPLFAKGEKGLQQLLDRIDDLGGGLSEEAIKELKESKIAAKEFDIALLSLKSKIVTQILPSVTKVTQFLLSLALMFGKAAEKSNVFKAAVGVLGAYAVAWALKTYAAYLPMLVVLAAMVLLVDDLITAWQGGNSVIIPFLNKIFGKGAGETVFKAAGKDLADFKKRLDEIDKKGGGIPDKIIEGFSSLGGTLVKFFADDIPDALGFLWGDIKSGLAGIWKAITDDLKMEWNAVVTQVPDLAKSLIDGLVNGIKEGAVWVIDAFKSLGTSAFAAIRNVFKSHSPSQALFEFAKEDLAIGGLAGGLDAGRPAVERSMSQMYSLPKSVGQSIQVTQHNRADVRIQGHGSATLANAARDGMSTAFNDDRRELLAALEATT